MQRKYTDEVYDELVNTIADINESDFSWITDALGDLGNTFASWVGLLSIDRYLNDVSTYHRKVLDQHNTTEEELTDIFRAVDAEDLYGAQNLLSLQEGAENYVSSLGSLAAMLAPGADFTADAIRAGGGQISSDLQAASDKINKVFDEQLTIREKLVAKEAGKELIGDILGAAISICAMPIQMISGDWAGAASSCWKLINSVFTTGEDLVALSTIGIGLLISKTSLGDNNTRYFAVNEAEDYQKRKGLADEIEDAGLEGVANAVRVVNVVADAYGLYKGVTGAYDTITEAGKVFSSDILTTETKFQYFVSEIVVPHLGGGHTDYNSGTLPGTFNNQKGVISTIQNIYEFVDVVTDPDKSVAEYFFDNNDLTSIGKDTSDMIEHEEEALEHMSGDPEPEPASP